MNCKPGDLAYISVPPEWESKKLHGMVVQVLWPRAPWPKERGKDERPTWWCKFAEPWFHDGEPMHQCFLLDAWLRPIGGAPVHDEQHDEVPA